MDDALFSPMVFIEDKRMNLMHYLAGRLAIAGNRATLIWAMSFCLAAPLWAQQGSTEPPPAPPKLHFFDFSIFCPGLYSLQAI